jgi:ketosteroid isomerase-like protein
MTESLDPSGDQWEIRQLIEQYAAAADRADGAALAALFTETGELEVWMDPARNEPTGLRRGRGEITEAVNGIGSYLATHHTIASNVVTIDGDRAEGETRCVGHHIEGPPDIRDRVLYIRYEEQLARVDGRWQFARREVHVQWVSIQSVDVMGTR